VLDSIRLVSNKAGGLDKGGGEKRRRREGGLGTRGGGLGQGEWT